MTDLTIHPDAVLASLTPDEQAKARAMLDDLHTRGYRSVDDHKGLRPGVRVRSRKEQYAEAYRDGTGWVWVVTEKRPSGWSESWGMPDVELIVVRDDSSFGSRLSRVAQYHVDIVDGAS